MRTAGRSSGRRARTIRRERKRRSATSSSRATATQVGPTRRTRLATDSSTTARPSWPEPVPITPFIESDAKDERAAEPIPQPQSQPDDPGFGDEAGVDAGTARDCGDFSDACTSGFTFFRRDTQVRSTADQLDGTREWIYIVYDATKPGTEAPTGTTYHTTGPGMGGQAATYFVRYNGANGTHTDPAVI